MSGDDDFFTGLGGGGGVVGETGFVDAGGQSSGGYMQEPQQQQTYGGDQYGVLVDDGDAQYGSMSMPMQDAADAQQYGSMPEPGYGGDPEGMDAMPAPSYKSKPTDPYSLEESAAVMAVVRAEFEAAVSARAEKEAAAAAEVRRRAEEELDGFYDQRTDEVARRQARSREQEEAFLRGVNASIEGSASNPWSRVCDLVDLKGSVVSSRSGGGGGGSASGSRKSSMRDVALEEDDAFRATEKMRSLIIQMKADTAHDAGDDSR